MSQGGEQRAWVPTLSLMLLMAGAGYLALDRPFELRRPQRDIASELFAADSGRVDARLWQDPFEAVESSARERMEDCDARQERAAKETAVDGRKPATHACIQVLNELLLAFRRNFGLASTIMGSMPDVGFGAIRFNLASKRPTLVIAAFVPADPFGEAYETRMRERFAISSALIRQGYHPADALGLHFLIYDSDPLKEWSDRVSRNSLEVVPYEVFELFGATGGRQNDRPNKVVVMWLKGSRQGLHEGSLENKVKRDQKIPRKRISPLRFRDEGSDGKLGGIVDRMLDPLINNQGAFCEWNRPASRCIGLALLGPPSSDELEEWAKDPVFQRLAQREKPWSASAAQRLLYECVEEGRPRDKVAVAGDKWTQLLQHCLTTGAFASADPDGLGWPEKISNELIGGAFLVPSLADEIESEVKVQTYRPILKVVEEHCSEALGNASDSVRSNKLPIDAKSKTVQQVTACINLPFFDEADGFHAGWATEVAIAWLKRTRSARTVLPLEKIGSWNTESIADAVLHYVDAKLENGLIVTLNGHGFANASAATRVYVNRATARTPEGKPPRREGMVTDIDGSSVRFVIPPDYAVTPLLAKEIRRRLTPQSCGPFAAWAPWRWGRMPELKRVLIVTEGETGYARNLVAQLGPELEREFDADGIDGCVTLNIAIADYIQGLDGEIGQPSTEKQSVGAARALSMLTSTPSTTSNASMLDYPAGRAQLDRVKDLILQEGRKTPDALRKPIDAIVIIGSDVYDKLLLIQAARAAAPRALLFTTDLDSRFLHSSEYPTTRNLIVVSGMGLTPRSISEHNSNLTFRDSYQTATYDAIRLALCEFSRPNDECVNALAEAGEYLGNARAPEIYEIGRTHAVNLSNSAIGTTAQLESSNTWRLLKLTLLIGVVLFIAALGTRYLLWMSSDAKLVRDLLIVSGVLVAYLTAYWLCFGPHVDVPAAEPYFLLEGVSIWPTQIVRQIATAMSLFMVVAMFYDTRRSDERIERRSPLISELGKLPRLRDGPNGFPWKNLWEVTSIGQWTQKLVDDTKDSTSATKHGLQDVWKEYRMLGRSGVRALRVGTAFVIGLIIFLTIWTVASEDTNSVPARGEVLVSAASAWRNAFFANGVSVFACVVTCLVCVCYVFDATDLCTTFVRWWSAVTNFGTDELEPRALIHAMQVVGERTVIVGRFILYPFILIAVLIVSRSDYFDQWGWPLSFVVVVSLVAAYSLISAWSLRREAERMRVAIRQQLHRRIIDSAADDKNTADLQAALSFVDEYHVGAFSEWFRNPLLRAMLLPAGGAGLATALLDAVAMA